MRSDLAKALFDEQVAKLSTRLLELRGWTVLGREYPTLEILFEGEGRQAIRLRFLFDDWDATPPSVAMFSKGGGALAKIPQAPGGPFHAGFGGDSRPFVCMAGVREYHNHPQHRLDHWDNYRGTTDFDLGGIVTRVWSAWTKAAP